MMMMKRKVEEAEDISDMLNKKMKLEKKPSMPATASRSADRNRELPLDLIVEILIRLPIKQVLKCSYVSKVWCSHIRKPEFIKAYRNHNPFGLLMYNPYSIFMDGEFKFQRHQSMYCPINIVSSGQQEFFNLDGTSLFEPKKGSSSPGFNEATQIINGLFCPYLGDRVFLVDVFADQVTQLPRPCILVSNATTRYYFGFVPATGLYKLLCLYEKGFQGPDHDHPDGIAFRCFYILNINGNDNRNLSWKLLRFAQANDDLYNLKGGSISVNGNLYWIKKQIHHHREGYVISCLDLTTEKFTHYRFHLKDHQRQARLVQFGGKLSMVYCTYSYMIIITVEMDRSWTMTKANLPDELQKDTAAIPVPIGNLLANQIILANCETNGSIISAYAYDHGSKNFEIFPVGKFPTWLNLKDRDDDVGSFISCMEQRLETLEDLIYQYSPKC